MDIDLVKAMFNPYVAAYLAVVVVTPLVVAGIGRGRRKRVARKRRARGLPDDVLMDHNERLSALKSDARLQAFVFLLAVIVAPFVLYLACTHIEPGESAETSAQGLAMTFAGLLIWAMFTGTDVAKAFLGGLAFKTLTAFKSPIQVGDRVTLQGHSGKVTRLGLFYVTLQTGTDDLVNIPTAGLWSEVLVSANAGERASLCVMPFYLDSTVTQEQRQRAEDMVWDAMQASPYLDAAKPMQIYISQDPMAIQLTAHGYVASTYDEPVFKSEVSRAFLDFAAKSQIPLARPP